MLYYNISNSNIVFVLIGYMVGTYSTRIRVVRGTLIDDGPDVVMKERVE